MIKFRSSREKLLATSFLMAVGMLFLFGATREHQQNNRFGDARQTAVAKASIKQMRYKPGSKHFSASYPVTVSFFTAAGQGIHADTAMTYEFGTPYFRNGRKEVDVIYLTAEPSRFRFLGELASSHWYTYVVAIAVLATAWWISRRECR